MTNFSFIYSDKNRNYFRSCFGNYVLKSVGLLYLFLLIFNSSVYSKGIELVFLKDSAPSVLLRGEKVLGVPKEGLWSVATGWANDWPCSWRHASPDSVIQSNEWTIVFGEMSFPEGKLLLRDSYRSLDNGLIQCRRRYEWKGKETLRHVTLAIRWQVAGCNLSPFLPGILYYGNKMGAGVNPDIIPVYDSSKEGEFAIFEEHRYPMPFAMLEDSEKLYGVALHVTPSPVRGAVLQDQWWSLGVKNLNRDTTELVMYSGPIGYNRQHGVAKARQFQPMKYIDTYLDLEPGRIIEKEFYLDLYKISERGTAFQHPVYTSLNLHSPYNADQFPTLKTIVKGKYEFAKKRWIENDEACGFNMYENGLSKDIIMGWCGQAEAPGYALQVLEPMLKDPALHDMVQRSMDFLSRTKVDSLTGLFSVGYSFKEKKYYGGDHVSCGQAMYSFAKAIEQAKKNRNYQYKDWMTFLKKACDGQVRRILDSNWSSKSTSECFYIAPLVLASKLFKNKLYAEAAIKVAEDCYNKYHDLTRGCYWGGTLDATCEDKEGAWAAFQGYLALYEILGKSDYLQKAKHAMDVCLSYVTVWRIPLPAGRLADYNFKTEGWTVVSPQNQHLDVYGVAFAPEIYKMGCYLKDNRLKKLSEVMFRSCYQLVDEYGSQGEQVTHTNFAQHGDMSNVFKLRGGYSERWTVFWITAHFLTGAAKFVEMKTSFL